MRLWGYYAFHSFMNSVKKIFRSQVVVVIFAIMLVGGIVGASVGIVASIMLPEELLEEDSSEEIAAEEISMDGEAGEDDAWEDLDEDTVRMIKVGIEAGIEILFIIILLSGMYGGSKKGSDIFLMADVNFLFTAPLKPQSVLLFRLSFQMAAGLLGSVYLLFQIPNLVMNLNLSFYAVAAIFLAWIVLILLQRLMSVLMYTLTATHESLHRFILPVIIGIVVLLFTITGAVYLSNGRDVIAAVSDLYASDASRMIPVVGWYKAMVMTAVEGEIGVSLVYMLLLVISMTVMVWGIWKIKADFYEDALAGAQSRDELSKAARDGSRTVEVRTGKKERLRKIRRNTEMKGWGANVFFTKEIYNRRRFAWFGLITKTMLTYLVVGTAVSIFCIRVLEFSDVTVTGVLLAAILFFRNYGNPIAAETSMNWLFLAPESPYQKVFYAMAAGTCACALDMLPAMIAAAVLNQAPPLLVLLWFVTLVAMDFMLSAVGMLLEAIFPATALDVVKGMIQMVLKFAVLFVIVLLLVTGYLLGGIMPGLLFVLSFSIVLGAVCFWIYPAMLHNGIS